MIEVIVGDVSRRDQDIKESWINQQVNRRLEDGLQVCVKVIIVTDNINVSLSTPACFSGCGKSRRPLPEEQRILGLWEKYKLSTNEFRGDNVIAFLKQLNML